MARRARTTPRKRPKQARSRATVDVILEATARVLVDVGYERATTNRIARVAGVSIGSLYQYFPSKAALVAALVERHVSRVTSALDRIFDSIDDEPPRVAARALVTGLLAMQSSDPGLHRVLVAQLPRFGRLQQIDAIETRFAERTLAYLRLHRDEIAIRHTEVASRLIIHALHGILFGLARASPNAHEADAVVEEMVGLVTRYIAGTAIR